MKKLISLSFAVLALMVTMTTVSFAQQSGKCGDNLTWELANGVLTISGAGDMYDYSIEEGTFAPWREYSDEICELNISDKVESIGSFAFRNLENIEVISLPDSIKKLGNCSISGCNKLKEIHLSSSIEVIPMGCFAGNILLKAIKLPESIKEIDDTAFAYSGIEEIEIPQNVTKMGIYAFESAESLVKINLSDNLSAIPQKAFVGAKNLRTVIFPENLKTISASAFEDCICLKEVYLPEGLETIDEYAFRNCVGMRKVYIPQSVSEISEKAFICTVGGPRENLPVTIYGYKDSSAQTFAEEYGYKFEEITDEFFDENQFKGMTVSDGKALIMEFTQESGKEIIKINADGKNIEFTDVLPFTDENGRVQVPVRALAEGLGCKVDYDHNLQSVTIISENNVIRLVIGGSMLINNTTSVQMDSAACIINDRTYVPVRFISEALGFFVVTSSNHYIDWGE